MLILLRLPCLLLLRRQENPIEELHRHLYVVLELSLGKLVPRDRSNVEHELFSSRTQHFNHIPAFLHPHDRPIIEMHLNRMVGKCSELA